MKVDLLVTTYKRLEDLLVLLNNLENQHYNNFTLQIFDGTPDKTIEEAVDYYRKRVDRLMGYEIIYRNTGPGMTRQRNIAIDYSTGEISIFLDDDVELEPDYLEKVVQIFKDDKEFKVAGLNGFDLFNLKKNQNKLGRRKKFYRRLGLYPDVGPARYLPWGHSTAHFNTLKIGFEEVDVLIGHNMAFRTAILKSFRFAEFFEKYPTYVLYDDQDICLRMKKAGYLLLLAYEARLIHKVAPSGRPAADHYGYQAFYNAYRNWKLHGSQKLIHKLKFWFWEFLDILFQIPSKNTRAMSIGRLKIFISTLFRMNRLKVQRDFSIVLK